jgi:hypothetical protein
MKLDDGKPWFRRWAIIGYWPISAEGRLVIAIMTAACLLAGFLIIGLGAHSPLTEVVLAFAIAVVLAGNLVAYWKREGGF